MPEIKLAKLPDRTPVKVSITIAPDLYAALSDYTTIYNQSYGQSEPLAELIPHMLAGFLASDRGFAKARASLPNAQRNDA
ncbi:DUF2274 domain-containing protein [Sphingomonas koreensis]|nr:DUF2274 domain-containing protein [Sphingomonas koreensis]